MWHKLDSEVLGNTSSTKNYERSDGVGKLEGETWENGMEHKQY